MLLNVTVHNQSPILQVRTRMYYPGDKIIINHPSYGHITVTVTEVHGTSGVEARKADGTEIWVGRLLIIGPLVQKIATPCRNVRCC